MAQELVLISKDRYETLTKKTLKVQDETKVQDTVTESNNDHKESLVRKIDSVLTIPGKTKKTVDLLYSCMSKEGVFDHNENLELIIDGKLIKGSNILDIIRHTVSPEEDNSKPPVGSKEFLAALDKLQTSNEPTDNHKVKHKTQFGGLFVRRKRRDALPGIQHKKKRLNWIKY